MRSSAGRTSYCTSREAKRFLVQRREWLVREQLRRLHVIRRCEMRSRRGYSARPHRAFVPSRCTREGQEHRRCNLSRLFRLRPRTSSFLLFNHLTENGFPRSRAEPFVQPPVVGNGNAPRPPRVFKLPVAAGPPSHFDPTVGMKKLECLAHRWHLWSLS
jgi:hypothetical protein